VRQLLRFLLPLSRGAALAIAIPVAVGAQGALKTTDSPGGGQFV
jgi:hypothetical protein